jgi:hypothetical protein
MDGEPVASAASMAGRIRAATIQGTVEGVVA